MDISIWQSIILGLVQGLGEFLPISSSGHLVLTPWLLGFSDPGLSFDVALHAGTLIAVILYFWKDILEILKLGLGGKTRNLDREKSYNSKTLWFLVLATIPGVLVGLFFEQKAETVFRNPLLIALTLSLAGLFLYLADKYARRRKDLGNISGKDSFIIGLSQAVAIIPGVSRSGATITTGLLLGLDRVSAARFSFLLSAPIIFGATVLKFPDIFRGGFGLSEIIGMIVASVSGYLAIKYLIKFVERVSYRIFFWYRLALALVIIVFYFFV